MRTLIVVVACLTLTSCGKKANAPVSTSSETPSNRPAPTAATTSPSDGPDRAQENLAKTTERLTQALRRFSAEHRRVPQDLNELVATGYLPELPLAPAGKRFVFDDQLRVPLK